MEGGRKLSAWNLFVKKVYREGKAKNPNYEFKQALADASKRKGEMKSHGSTAKMNKKGGRSHKRSSKRHRKSRRSTRRR
jgi:hypothetical protein